MYTVMAMVIGSAWELRKLIVSRTAPGVQKIFVLYKISGGKTMPKSGFKLNSIHFSAQPILAAQATSDGPPAFNPK